MLVSNDCGSNVNSLTPGEICQPATFLVALLEFVFQWNFFGLIQFHGWCLLFMLSSKICNCRGFDDELRAVVARNLEGRGIHMHPQTNLTEVSKIC